MGYRIRSIDRYEIPYSPISRRSGEEPAASEERRAAIIHFIVKLLTQNPFIHPSRVEIFLNYERETHMVLANQ